jgi:hypothetical protein
MSLPAVAVDFLEQLDILLDLPSEIPFDHVGLEFFTDKVEFGFGEGFDFPVPLDAELVQNDLRKGSSHSV